MKTNQYVRTAVIQAAPIIMDREKTLNKALDLIKEAKNEQAEIVVFPEAFIPAYPRGLSFGYLVGSRTMEGRNDFLRYYKNAVPVPGDTTEKLGEAARKAGIYLVIGVTEIDTEKNNNTLYCTILYFGPDGRLLDKHQKLKPTGSERLIWGEGDGSTLSVVNTPHGKLGGLICWENYMPLARTAMYQKGVSLYVAPTADARSVWQSTIRHIALEGRCYVLSCNQFVTKDMYPDDLEYYHELQNQPNIMCSGGSAIVNPMGEYVVEPVYNKEEMLLADLNMDLVIKGKMDFDVVGHYDRTDVFQLKINENE
ncbi:carbon-nitrogen hydrolase family protein [Natranaerobius thermophilus]|uniref:Nitrilase/cyanide hydratase and apolipoprotein N-acyltransferase n=1 Tax=Natranaerobius thermophilus (strain ATCC BAA-1301 / DSM 18059 / JW/NM-WN-LF) TaxID=457570 RepID=B2A133_NATTJ|nr:carbon-nitrogen hydrolase family protein [Natranaerobius thermophilus]ACB84656.1 Nitrilase/cyanide hydratase and apolipoprotein N-acyltransferase [Natranaerobius thermophilus JW/NM-WN-LF]